jgi:hypothetical protein
MKQFEHQILFLVHGWWYEIMNNTDVSMSLVITSAECVC